MPPMPALPALITDHLAEVRALCEKYRVKRLTLFGSAVKGTFEFGREIDLVVLRSIKNPYFVQVRALTEQPLYESTRAA